MPDELVTAFGLTKSVEQWEQDPLCRATASDIRFRIWEGWQPERALTTPSKSGQKLSRYKGVTWDSAKNRWRAQIKHDRKLITLGRFDDERQAALAYDAKCRELRGMDAETNFSD